MKKISIITCFALAEYIQFVFMQHCGCKDLNYCYSRMLEDLLNENEEPCVENAEIGSIAITIYLKALERYCGRLIKVNNQSLTFQSRNLYEVMLLHPNENVTVKNNRPVILLEAGQLAGIESVNFALYVIEQLVACRENIYMLKNVRWVILPNTNPDGREFSRYTPGLWRKNLRYNVEDRSAGVDISRNFDHSFNECGRVSNGFSPEYPGRKAMSENETMFIVQVLNKYKHKLKAYVSIRRDGHALLYPFSSTNKSVSSRRLIDVAALITAKINQRFGFIELLNNRSIFDMNRKMTCGSSVDYVYARYNQPYSYEMRVFLESDHRILTKFQTFPRGYQMTLRLGYFSVIKELYNVIVAEQRNKTLRATRI